MISRSIRASLFSVALAAAFLAAAFLPAAVSAQEEAHCVTAERFMTGLGMTAVTGPDTLDDWRTRKRVPGCRITAAAVTAGDLGDEATQFYERLRSAGWERTPDPRDAPNEASLRFRREATDCLFNFYTGGILGTEAERKVNYAVTPGRREIRYNTLVLCIPAMEAAPRP